MKGMKSKTIAKALDAKLEEWIATIDDDRLKILLNRDVIVTGGSIASMLLGEEVNDYDIYFKTMETTEAVARYYADKFNKFEDVSSKVMVITGKDGQHVKSLRPDLKEDRVCIYIQSEGLAKAVTEEEYAPIFISDNAISLNNDIQLILRFHGTVEEIHKNFDFVHATCSYDWETDKVETPKEALAALLSKDLFYSGGLYPICSLFRMRKFIKRGFTINGGQILKMAFQISELDLTDIDVLRDQLVGVDTFYFLQIIESLNEKKEADPSFVFDACYISEIIDKLFD